MQTALDTLRHLAQVDIDAIRAYSQAIAYCGDAALARMLSEFRDDHRRHVRELSGAIHHLGGETPRQADATGFGIAAFTAISAMAGPAGALTAMESNEVVTNDAYSRALAEDLPAELRALVQRNHRDEQRHLASIRAWLEESVRGGRALSRAGTLHGRGSALWMNRLRTNLPAALIVGAGAALLVGGMVMRAAPRLGAPRRM